ncbi:MAG: penicillin acylase family protein [Alphaproteobacteria bacterium]|nr:penicillin acylase family protein [Alphaproteobacteria bacterium]
MAKAKAAKTARNEKLTIAGLRAPVEICVDSWGVPHIRAKNLSDLFFAQGFNAARDRLWQIDLARKRGLGLLAADFGPGYLAQDRAARLFLYRGDMKKEWSCYGADSKQICTAFAKGINAYIDLIEKQPKRLQPEFAALGTRPQRWKVEDVVRIRSHAWMRNALAEVIRANIMANADPETDLLRQNLEPAITPKVEKGIDLKAIPLKVLDNYRLAITPVAFSHDRLGAKIEEALSWTKVTPLADVIRDTTMQGSNNWAISGNRTATGRPILGSDPHRLHAIPSLRYLVHLTAPDFDAIGTGEAVFPGIMIGHNGDAACGLTLFFGPDEEDIYVYKTDPNNSNRYQYKGRYERMKVVTERVSVKGVPDQTLTLKFTRHGPVIFEDATRNLVFAMRTLWTEPGTTAYGASLISMRARSFEKFRDAMRKWAVPAVSQVYADRKGTIGWITAGITPIRKNYDGLLPVPGDGRFEWSGYVKPDHMPWVKNPKKGFVTTSNEMNVPADWKHIKRPIGYEWWEPSRARRIQGVLKRQPKHTLKDSMALQTDVHSMPAERLKALFKKLKSGEGESAKALALLAKWDHRLEADSGPAALFEIWWAKHLKPTLLAQLVPNDAARALIVPGDVESILRALEKPGPGFESDPKKARDRLLLATLASAYRDCAERMGDNAKAWRWGKIHHGFFEHAVSAIGVKSDGASFNVGPLPKGGGDSTPMMAAYRPMDFRVTLGASVRIVIDVGDWDKSKWINSPGQSGDPRSPHYGDLAPLWAKGKYVPMLYSEDAVDRATEQRIILKPSAR